MTRQECTDCLRMVIEDEYGAALNNFLGKECRRKSSTRLFGSVQLRYGALKWQWAQALKKGDYTRSAALLRTTAVTAKGKTSTGPCEPPRR